MDFIEGFPTSRGKNIILVMVDQLTKYGHFVPLAHPFITITIPKSSLTRSISYVGLLNRLCLTETNLYQHNLVGVVQAHGNSSMKTKPKMSTAYYPQTDG